MHKEFDTVFYPFYGMLTTTEKVIYQNILPGIRAAKTALPVGKEVKASAEQAFHAVRAIYNDRPELFWMDGGCNVKTLNNFITTIHPSYNNYSKDYATRQVKLRKAIQSYILPAQGKQPVDQERIIHDKMVKDISYMNHALDQTAYAALVEGKAVCAGYTRAFQLLMQELDIPCYYCQGDCLDSKTRTWGPHAWNIIKLGSDFYNMDITWNDCYDSSPRDNIGYTYYNCTDSVISTNHRRSDACKRLPPCRGTKYSFEKVTGTTAELNRVLQDGVTYKTPVTSKPEYFNLVEQHLRKHDSKNVIFSFPAKGSIIQQNSTKWLGEIVSKVYPRRGYSINTRSTDYKNGWYKLELTVDLK